MGRLGRGAMATGYGSCRVVISKHKQTLTTTSPTLTTTLIGSSVPLLAPLYDTGPEVAHPTLALRITTLPEVIQSAPPPIRDGRLGTEPDTGFERRITGFQARHHRHKARNGSVIGGQGKEECRNTRTHAGADAN